ncbi:cell wall-associated NlpC family hydrolase [Krasilnikovia cinnamomea]|uniref:Cell wall-associated NlpC family hydrolase n=1 Tax=Krasilnikovia cinnamomea TaxID=349313 RepID=A0A4Q7ZN37_9ACTN|nr:cell wall-associated NlpC family hydrolase [Krasilnikovia cinnamomea]
MVAFLAVAITGSGATAAHAAPSTSDINKKIEAASNQLEDVVESYNKMKISLAKTKSDEKNLAASLGPAREALKSASAQVQTIASSAYMTGTVGTVNVLLEGPDSLMDRMSFLDQLSRSRQRDIATFTETTQTYAQRQAALKSTQDKQAAELKELTARKSKIEADLKKLYAMRRAAFGSETESGSRYTGRIPTIPGSAGTAVKYAFNAIGAMYHYGSDGPYNSGYDCSGLTSAAWSSAGKSLPHNAAAQYSATARISRADLKPGDLVFYRSLGHVGLYVGGGQIIDASRAGVPVKKRSIDVMPPYGYGRVR